MSVISVLLAHTSMVSLALVLTGFIFLYFYWKSSKSSNYSFPPGPPALPVIGNLNILDLHRPYKTLSKLSETYGNVFTFHMGPKKYVVLTGYEAVKEALVTQADDFSGRGQMHTTDHFSKGGNGIIFGKGESWRVMRRFTLSILRDFGMGKKTIEDRIIEESQKLVEVFQSHKGKAFDPQIIINSAVSNIICSIVFGDRFDYNDPQFLNLQRILNENLKLIVSPKTQLCDMFPFLGFFLSDHKKANANSTLFQGYFRNTYKDLKDTVDSNDLRSFIDTFISRQREEEARNSKYFHEDNMAVTASELFAAGTETTSTTLLWGLLLMMKYPHIQEKVQEEIESVIGRERPPRAEDRKSMPYMDAVLHEIQRVGNVVPMNLLHETTGDTTFRGYRIPKTQWETPHQFNPNHFLDAQGKFVKRDAFMPFSAGRRVCLGETLAKMELFLFFTMLLQKFHFRLPQEVSPEQLDLTPTPGITSSPQPFQLCALSH
ncbi:cytochrome P450 2K3-like isoform X2 [Polyodon spathula]|uniref:cytochrome P450 2K3-like isoform X2 n=1 Tax=Polyodon spathula TaxID=7913 RepID=UPI001B7E985C|nr:cytochrome P450 2K3-like isoform X2 [Polyodon spathula]